MNLSVLTPLSLPEPQDPVMFLVDTPGVTLFHDIRKSRVMTKSPFSTIRYAGFYIYLPMSNLYFKKLQQG